MRGRRLSVVTDPSSWLGATESELCWKIIYNSISVKHTMTGVIREQKAVSPQPSKKSTNLGTHLMFPAIFPQQNNNLFLPRTFYQVLSFHLGSPAQLNSAQSCLHLTLSFLTPSCPRLAAVGPEIPSCPALQREREREGWFVCSPACQSPPRNSRIFQFIAPPPRVSSPVVVCSVTELYTSVI